MDFGVDFGMSDFDGGGVCRDDNKDWVGCLGAGFVLLF